MLPRLWRRTSRSAGSPKRKPQASRILAVESLDQRLLLTASTLAGLEVPLALSASIGAATGQGASASETAAGDSINAFAQDLYAQLQSEKGGGGNLVMSPFSIATALAMTYSGAEGETAAQMANALHLPQDPNAVSSEFGALLSDLNSAGQAGGFTLNTADALWGQQGLPFNSAFLNLMQSDYGGQLRQVDYADDPYGAAQTINNWVADQTNDKIQNLIPPGYITPVTQLVLANAIYFKGNWATAFDNSLTQDANFTLASGGQVNVSMMHQTNSYGYMDSDGYQVLELPYAGGRLAMDVILPDAGSGLSTMDVSQLPSDLGQWLDGLRMQQVNVSLPKFQMTTSFDLSQPLQALGITDAFSNAADFSGITNATQLQINAVVHKAFIDVDETGTEAAAATAVGCEPTFVAIPQSPPIVFNADHPFLFTIRDTQTGTVLFMGQETNPALVVTAPAPTAPDPAPVATNPVPTAPDPAPVAAAPVPTAPNPAPVATNPAPTAPLRPPSSRLLSQQHPIRPPWSQLLPQQHPIRPPS